MPPGQASAGKISEWDVFGIRRASDGQAVRCRRNAVGPFCADTADTNIPDFRIETYLLNFGSSSTYNGFTAGCAVPCCAGPVPSGEKAGPAIRRVKTLPHVGCIPVPESCSSPSGQFLRKQLARLLCR